MIPARLAVMALGAVSLLLPLMPQRSLAQTTSEGLAIPAAHPRVWWTPDRIARGRAWYQSNPFTPSSDDALGLATRSVLSGEGSYCQAAVTYAMNKLCNNAACNSPDPTYGVASDDARWEGENVILVYDWCYAYFTPDQRDTLISRWNTYFQNIRMHTWGGPAMVESNYDWGYMRNEIEWGVATLGDNPQASTNLHYGLSTRWTDNIVPHFSSGGRGGVFQEGSQYGSTIGYYSTVPFGSAAALGRDVYRETNFFREAVFYLIYATLPGLTYNKNNGGSYWEVFPFADDEWFRDGGFAAKINYGNFMSAMADYWRDVPVGQYARRWVNTVNPERARHVRAVDRGGAERDFGALPLDYYAPGPRFAYARSQWGGQATVLSLQLGVTQDEGHRHNDVGTWQLWRAGRWLSRETTGYSDTIVGYGGQRVDTNNAAAHNSLLIGGRGPAMYYQAGPTQVTRLESTPGYLYAAVDLTSSYRATETSSDNANASHVEREFLFVRPLETLIVFDRIETTTAAVAKTFLAHFEASPAVDVAARTVTATNGGQVLRLRTLVPAAPTYRAVVDEGAPVGQYRLEVETSGAAQSHFLTVMQSRGVSDEDVAATVTEDEASYTVSLVHATRGNAAVTFEKGRASSGGRIVIGGMARNLTTGVAQIAVDDEGVKWAPALAAPTGLKVGP